VTTARSWTTAVAAMRISLTGIALPAARRRARSSAHFKPVSASQGRHWRRPAPASNQRSTAAGTPQSQTRACEATSAPAGWATAVSVCSGRWPPGTSQLVDGVHPPQCRRKDDLTFGGNRRLPIHKISSAFRYRQPRRPRLALAICYRVIQEGLWRRNRSSAFYLHY